MEWASESGFKRGLEVETKVCVTKLLLQGTRYGLKARLLLDMMVKGSAVDLEF